MREGPPVAGLISRDRAVIAGCITVVTALAWLYLLHLSRQMQSTVGEVTAMPSMSMSTVATWSSTAFFLTFAMWATMMVGMMSPTVTPALLLFSRMRRNRGREVSGALLLFGLGYILVWVGFSAAAALAQLALNRSAVLSTSMAETSSYVAGAILILAGVYQLTPVKSRCLRQCQSPLGFLLTNWRDGATGALVMGLKHGRYCLGCCWALMCVLFAVGVMNLAWVAALAAFILVEKFGRPGYGIARLGGMAIIAFGFVVIVRHHLH